MKIQTRLIVLLFVLLAVFGATLAALRHAHVRESRQLMAEIAQEREELLVRLLELTGLTLKTFASDYSLWSEMADFVRHADPKWAEVNIDASLPNFNVHAAWVLRPDGAQVYGAVRDLDASFRQLPPSAAQLIARANGQPREAHYFETTPAGLIEFRISPVQPSDDVNRTSPPLGWLVAARLWDDAHRGSLQQILEGDIAILPQASPAAAAHARVLHHELPDANGGAAAVLHVTYHPQALHLIERENVYETALFFVFGGAMLLFTVGSVSRWILRPLRQLEQSLATGNATPLIRLRHERDEFGRLATLVESSFEQRQALQREIEERRRIEEALRQSQEDLRSAAELKSRLARDLHDGVIQSIYAAGLGMEGIRALLRQDPDGADRRLVAAQTSLNQTIREVRSFIHGLEPEETDRPSFPQALRSLVATLQTLHAAELRLHIDTAPTLSAREEVHSLQIVRECVSNALRHGGARRVEIRFCTDAGGALLEIRDDGRGFDPAHARDSGGSGLANLASRAAEIGARLEIHSSPGKGTGISLRFNQNSNPA